VISASNNSQPGSAFAKNPAMGPIAISTTGWYKFTHRFYNNAGVLAVDMRIYDSANVLVNSWTRSNPADLIGLIGGNRYGWFDFNEFSTLAFDNARLVNGVRHDDIVVNADAGVCTAVVTFDLLPATDNCDSTPTVVASPPSGSTFPNGDTTVTITATDDCGNFSTSTFTVTVSDFNDLVVDVELGGGVMNPGTYTRCITFELWNGAVMTHSTAQIFTFTAGNMAPETLEVPCGPYTCITARDRLHTLRRTISPLPTVGTQYVAEFTTANGNNQLIGGNLNDDKFIDILDFGIYSLHDLALAPGGASTTCAQVPPFRHPDIDGSGFVDSFDFGYIGINFLQIRENNCDGSSTTIIASDDSPGGNYGDAPITAISVNDLVVRGMGELAVMDLNHDGQFNLVDRTLWMQGVRPKTRRVTPGVQVQEESTPPTTPARRR
ncbi:MAG TPA: HYR domain-containing protein, partial [Phycisphaerae bacterium]|nr:HYR domain-containing protein [Phycisphaerae bacterium]